MPEFRSPSAPPAGLASIRFRWDGGYLGASTIASGKVGAYTDGVSYYWAVSTSSVDSIVGAGFGTIFDTLIPYQTRVGYGTNALLSIVSETNPSNIVFLTLASVNTGTNTRYGIAGYRASNANTDAAYLGSFVDGEFVRVSVLPPQYVPSGGSSGQALVKTSGTDFATAWGTAVQLLDSQTWSSSTTYTIPTGAKIIILEVIGAGGGGGAGGKNSLSAQAGGGAGGGGGGYWKMAIPAVEFSSPVTVTIGLGGTGGTGLSATGTGPNGSFGGHSRFGGYYFPGGAPGGGGSSASGGVGGKSLGNQTMLVLPDGVVTAGFGPGTGGSAGTASPGAVGIRNLLGGAGGGGGGGVGTGNVQQAGAAGGTSETDSANVVNTGFTYYNTAGGSGGTAGTAGGGAGGNGSTAGAGGGGGGSGSNVSGGAGGTGSSPGGGGGGGGGNNGTGNSGSGGNGSTGQMKIWVYG